MELEGYHLDQILEAAVIESWPDLMPNGPGGLIHVEYDFAENGRVKFLQIWSSTTRGYWRLVCTYCVSGSSFQSGGVQFENGYAVEGLTRVLNLAMRHQDALLLPANLGRQGFLQITAPTANENVRASAILSAAFEHVNSKFAGAVPARNPIYRGASA